jgi:hypothetical protein
MHAKTLMLAAAAVLTLGVGSAYASEGQYVSPITGEPTELTPAFPDVPTHVTTAQKAPSASSTQVYSSTYSNYTTDPSVMRMLFPEDVNEN